MSVSMTTPKGSSPAGSGLPGKRPDGEFDRRYRDILGRETARSGQVVDILTSRVCTEASGNTPFGIHFADCVGCLGNEAGALASVVDRQANLLAMAHARFNEGLHHECICCPGEISEARLEAQQAITCTTCQKLLDGGFTFGQLHHLQVVLGISHEQISTLFKSRPAEAVFAILTGGK